MKAILLLDYVSLVWIFHDWCLKVEATEGIKLKCAFAATSVFKTLSSLSRYETADSSLT